MSKEIAGIRLIPMPNGAHYNFMQSTLERAKADEAVNGKLQAEIAALETALAKENDHLKVAQKSSLTALISAEDTKRDTLYIGYKNAVKGFFSLPEGDMKEAAVRLWDHVSNYKLNPNDQLDKQTGMLSNFIEDLEEQFKDDVAKLGLAPFVAGMKAANEQVRTLMKQRDDENSTKQVGATKVARRATDDVYRLLVKKVNAMALLEDETKYAAFIDGMNAQIIRYKREVLKQSGVSSGNGDGDSPITDPDTEGGNEDDRPIIE